MKNYTPHGWFPWIRNRPLRIAVELVAFVVVLVLLGIAVGAGVRALAVEPPDRSLPQRCVDMQQDPCRQRAAAFAARKFRHDRLGHVNARERRIFSHPHRARKVMIHRIGRALRHHRPEVAVRAATARVAYTRWLRSSDCGAYRPYNPYTTGIDVCSLAGPQNKLSPSEIKDGVTVAICGAGVVVGVIAAPPTGSASWWVVGLGATSCFWGAYLQLSD